MSLAREMWDYLKYIGFEDISNTDKRLSTQTEYKYNIAKGDLCACRNNLKGNYFLLFDASKWNNAVEIDDVRLNIHSVADLEGWLRKEYPELLTIKTCMLRTYIDSISYMHQVIRLVEDIKPLHEMNQEDIKQLCYKAGLNQGLLDLLLSSPSIEPPTELATLKLRPLVWTNGVANCVLGHTEVYISGHYNNEPKWNFIQGSYIDDDGLYNTLEEAQQAAEKRYKGILLSCFEGYPIEEKAEDVVPNIPSVWQPLYVQYTGDGEQAIYTQSQINKLQEDQAKSATSLDTEEPPTESAPTQPITPENFHEVWEYNGLNTKGGDLSGGFRKDDKWIAEQYATGDCIINTADFYGEFLPFILRRVDLKPLPEFNFEQYLLDAGFKRNNNLEDGFNYYLNHMYIFVFKKKKFRNKGCNQRKN